MDGLLGRKWAFAQWGHTKGNQIASTTRIHDSRLLCQFRHGVCADLTAEQADSFCAWMVWKCIRLGASIQVYVHSPARASRHNVPGQNRLLGGI
jgi:hypothetical protein